MPVIEQPGFLMKLLSGQLNGLELPLGRGSHFFCVGQDEFLNQPAAQTLKSGSNTVFLPADHDGVNFTLRVDSDVHESGASGASLSAIAHHATGDEIMELPFNRATRIGSMHFAVVPAGTPWDESIERFTPIQDSPESAALPPAISPAPVSPRSGRAARLAWSGLAFAGAAAAICLAAWQWLGGPGDETGSLQQALDGAALSYQTATGRDQMNYVVADSEGAAEWARQALVKQGMYKRTIVLTRPAEAERVASVFKQKGIAYFTVRLDDVQRPQIVVSADRNPVAPVFIADLKKTAMQAMPYARTVDVLSMTDDSVLAIARAGLDRIALPYRVERNASGVLLSSAGVVDDVQLAELNDFTRRFRAAWGDYINIQIQLADPPYKGRPHTYGRDAYVMTARNQWDFLQPFVIKD